MHVYLEVLISLIGLFIVFSIINSVLVEWIGLAFNARGRYLKSKLFDFFGGVEHDGNMTTYLKKLFSMEDRKKETDSFKEDSDHLGRQLYAHPLIRTFFKSKYRWPSYIQSDIFSESLLGILKPIIDEYEKSKDPKVLKKLPLTISKPLETILAKAEQTGNEKLKYIQGEIETLYNALMARSSEWYKRRIRIWLLLFGTIGAYMFNIDTIHIFQRFSDDGELRREYYNFAALLDKNRDSIKIDTVKIMDFMNLAVTDKTQKDSTIQNIVNAIIKPVGDNDAPNIGKLDIGPRTDFGLSLSSLIGILLTGIALSFGSTFWFQMLRQLLRLGKSG